MFAFLCVWRLTAADVGHTLSIVIPTTWTGNRTFVSITHSLALQLKVDEGLPMVHRASPPVLVAPHSPSPFSLLYRDLITLALPKRLKRFLTLSWYQPAVPIFTTLQTDSWLL